jgi:capsular polysaccharide biosynthesis protein
VFEDIVGEYQTVPPYIYQADDVSVLVRDEQLVAVADKKDILLTLVDGKSHLITNIMAEMSYTSILYWLSRVGMSQEDAIIDRCVLFFPTENYGHFMLDYLPLLRDIENSDTVDIDEIAFLTQSDHPRWAQSILEEMGYGNLNCIEWDPEWSLIHVEELIVSSHRSRHRDQLEYSRPSDLEWVRNKIQPSIETVDDTAYPSRIWISRENQDHWRVRNEEEVLATLGQYGFEKYKPEQMSINEQVQLWSQAEMVVSPVGAAATNMIFAEDVTLVELHPKSTHTEEWNFTLANQLDITYRYLECEPVENNYDSVKHDMMVHCEVLDRVVRRLL